MPDEQVTILISAIDDVSKKLDTIKKNVGSMAKESEKQTTSMGSAFKESTGTLLALGNVAARVDSIFDSYENIQLRVENATTRVFEASKNVRDAQYALGKVMKDSTATIEDVTKAKDDLESASNRLQMSENNLQKTNNQVTGTYIQMGMSMVTLIASIPTLVAGIQSVALSLFAVEIAAAPVLIAMVALTAIIVSTISIYKNLKSQEEENINTAKLYETIQRDLVQATKELGIAHKTTTDEINKMHDAMSGKVAYQSEDELKKLEEIARKKEEIANMGDETKEINKAVSKMLKDDPKADPELIYKIAVEQSKKSIAERALTDLETSYNAEYTVKRKHDESLNELAATQLAISKELLKEEEDFSKLSDIEKAKNINQYYYDEDLKNQKAYEATKAENLYNALRGQIAMENEAQRQLRLIRAGNQRPNYGALESFYNILQGALKGPTNPTSDVKLAAGGIVNSPTRAIIGEAGPEAVIPLEKFGGMGKTIIIQINGNNYGTDPDEIANALNEKLGTMVRTW